MSGDDLDAVVRILVPALGAAALAGPMLQSLSYRTHAEQGMAAVALVAAGAGSVSGGLRPWLAAAAPFAATIGASLVLTLVSYDAEGSFRLNFSLLAAMVVGAALGALGGALAGAEQRDRLGIAGAWSAAIGVGALAAAIMVEDSAWNPYQRSGEIGPPISTVRW